MGSRRANQKDIEAAYLLSQLLSEHSIIVANGLAEGIDTAVHTSVIEAHGQTLAVLGTLLDQVYPQKNRRLQQVIMQNHLAVSQFPSGTPVRSENFLLRNQTIAQLTKASIIVETQTNSGSLNHACHALQLGHPLFIYQSLNETQNWVKQILSCGARLFEDPCELFVSNC